MAANITSSTSSGSTVATSQRLPIEERRALLEQLPLKAPLRRVERLDGDTPWERACREGWEGVIAKRRGSPYEHRRSKHWLKMKCEASQELVVGGYTDPQGARVGLGALLVGYFEGNDFVFAGKVGTGFDTKLLLDLRSRLRQDRTARHRRSPKAPACPDSCTLGAPGDCGAGIVYRMDRPRKAASSTAHRRPLRQERARGPERA